MRSDSNEIPLESVERKLVTSLFCDLVGSTQLGERLDAEVLRRVQSAYFDRMRSVVTSFGGTVEKFIGDAVVAVFGAPLAHEDDALRAVTCALAMREAIDGLNDTLSPRFGIALAIRIGVTTDEAVVGDRRRQEALATGDVMNTAARLEQAAAPAEVLVDRQTMTLTRSGIDYEGPRVVAAKGKPQPLEAWLARRVAPTGRRLRSSFVGRETELQHLAAALETAIKEQRPQTVVVIGPPGMGKTRLVAEFADRAAGRATFCRGACPPYGEGAWWTPLEAILRSASGDAIGDEPDQTRARIEAAISARHNPEEASLLTAQITPLFGSADAITSSGELGWALRRYLEALAGTGPTVVVLDDLHWASETLLSTVAEMIEGTGRVPLVFVCAGRPELREHEGLFPDHARSLTLSPLQEEESRRLALNLTRGLVPAGESLLDTMAERAEGNPLFLEEIAAMIADDVDPEALPGSLRALIAARLDLLPDDAKRTVQAGAVLGERFGKTAVAAVWGETASPTLEPLVTRGLIEPESEPAPDADPQFQFHHALIREVAYRSLSKLDRSYMHRRAGGGFPTRRRGAPSTW